MQHYWELYMGPRPGIEIKEVVTKYDNVYIKDKLGRVYQIWIENDYPLIQKVGEE